MLDIATMPTWLLLLEIALLLIGVMFALMLVADVLKQRRAPAATSAWLLVLVLLPYVGVLLYLLFGARKLDRPRQRLARLPPPNHPAIEDHAAHGLDLLLRSLGAGGAVGGHHVQIHHSPEQALAELLRVINSAKQRVLIDMYAFDDDEVGAKVFAALTQQAKAGVAVYVLIDDIGSIAARSHTMRALRAAGGQLVRFKPVTKLFRVRLANLRNHRKIVVADACLAWTGGRNIAWHYLSALAEPDAAMAGHQRAWQDASCTVAGFAASALEDIARSDWRFATGVRLPALQEEREIDALVSDTNNQNTVVQDSVVQVVPSGPDLRDDVWYSALLSLCYTAKRRIWLVTPYFVPDEALLGALALAARRGVEVQIITPKRSDNRLVDLVRQGYMRDLVYCGAAIKLYEPQMLHAKLVLVDDQVAAIGTANLDARSLFLNYEVMTVFYSHADIAEIGSLIRGYLAQCSEYKFRANWLRDTLAAPLKLLAPLL